MTEVVKKTTSDLSRNFLLCSKYSYIKYRMMIPEFFIRYIFKTQPLKRINLIPLNIITLLKIIHFGAMGHLKTKLF